DVHSVHILAISTALSWLHSYQFSYTIELTYLASVYFIFNAPATSEIYTLSLHDALPIYAPRANVIVVVNGMSIRPTRASQVKCRDRKSTRLNSSHEWISYAVFCLKKKNDLRTR